MAALAFLIAGCGGGLDGHLHHDSSLASIATAINNDGMVVGFGTDSNDNDHALLFPPTGATVPTSYTVQDIGNLGGTVTHVTALSNTGYATGYSEVPGPANHAFVYHAGTMTDIGVLQFDVRSIGSSVNNNGVVVGESLNASAETHPFVYTAAHGYQQVATPDHRNIGVLTGINDGEVMVGYYETTTHEIHSFNDLMDNSTYDLTTLAGVQGTAEAVNNSFAVVGDSSPTGGWSYVGETTYSSLPNHGGKQNNFIRAVNDGGVIVGADLFGTHLHAVSYTNGIEKDLGALGDAHVVDLNTLISSGDQQTYGRLTDATGINASGQICCNTTSGKAIILTPVP